MSMPTSPAPRTTSAPTGSSSTCTSRPAPTRGRSTGSWCSTRFCESYHVRTLHKNSLAPTFDSNAEIFEPFGPHMLGIGLRKDTIEQTTRPREEWSLLARSTAQCFLIPGALVVHQIDHVEVWRLQPIDVRTTEA